MKLVLVNHCGVIFIGIQMNETEIISNLMMTPSLNAESSTSATSCDSSGTSSSTSSSISSSDDDDDDIDLLFFPLMQYLTSGKRRCRIQNYLQTVDSMPDTEFKEHFRLTRGTALQLIEELELSGRIPSHTFGMTPISAKWSFLIFLWYMANTEPLRTISDRFDVSISSVFRVIRRVMNWLLTKLDDVIKWPQGHEVIRLSDEFAAKRGIRNVIGAIDGTHIRIEKPRLNARDYCNRKRFFSINLQAVVDANMRFTNICVGEPGSLHDARVLRRSSLFQTANVDKELLFPANTFIIGDSAYASLSWLVPPFRDNGHLAPQQIEFNFLHSSTRMAVERAFGCLKGRFRRIKFFTEYREMSFITNIVVAACILHNYCIDVDDEYDFDAYVDECLEDMNDEVLQVIDRRRPVDRRMELFLEMFPGNVI